MTTLGGPAHDHLAMSNTKTLVLGIFEDEASADAAAQALKDSGVAKSDAVGVLVLNDKGELKAEKVGTRSSAKGAGIGLVLALVTPVGWVTGLVGGGLLGALHHKGLGLDASDRERLSKELEGGRAALGVLSPVAEAEVVADKLKELGGTTEAHVIAERDLAEAQEAVASNPPAS